MAYKVMAALSIGVDDRKSIDTDAGLRPVTGPPNDLFAVCAACKTRNIFADHKAVQRVHEVYVFEEWTRWTESEA